MSMIIKRKRRRKPILKKEKEEAMLLGLICFIFIIGTAFGAILTDITKDTIPKSEEGETFVLRNVLHCQDTYEEVCWIKSDEFNKFEKYTKQRHFVSADFTSSKLIFRLD